MAQARRSLESLEQKKDFVRRHIGPTAKDQAEMAALLGVDCAETLIKTVVPDRIYLNEDIDLPDGITEDRAIKRLRKRAQMNEIYQTFIGQGYYGTITPPVILRNVLENPGWYTAYTPYQAEISQGRLEALLNFQHMVVDLTGLPIANASLLDEATAAAEAMTLARRVGKSKSNVFLVADDCHPQTIEVIQTRAAPLGIEVVLGNPQTFYHEDCFAQLLQYPNTFGDIVDYKNVVSSAHEKGALVIVATDLLALTLLQPPGEFGADIAVGSAQRFGVPMGYGGPHAAFLSTRTEFQRQIPGRIVGAAKDSAGNTAYRLALQTREQHIRRDKATSNICTAQVLLANIAGFYAVYHGPDGLIAIARRLHRLTAILKEGLTRLGFEIRNTAFFDTLTVITHDKTRAILHAARENKMNLRRISEKEIGISIDETATRFDIKRLWRAFHDNEDVDFDIEDIDAEVGDQFPGQLERHTPFLTHPVFNRYHSETEMMRYLHRLEQKDIALNRSMIPLGSCTMKLNAAVEMLPVTWPEFAHIHPFAPQDQVKGYHQMMDELEVMLCKLTGFAAVSLQPNAGSQGEYAGLLTIQAYHASRGEAHRNVCLIPSSAHGTNPASAVMAGMRVVVVQCDDHGNIDVDDLRNKVVAHKDDLAAIMITYPSTHGVFEDCITDVCDLIHDHGGQVYMDGANLNAMLCAAQPGKFGADVMHMNLHKTFCIPHGGGGPGVGPIGVAGHLVPFLPTHKFKNTPETDQNIGAVSAAPFGSASILPISWMYIMLMGRSGLRLATQVAVLNANYMAHCLKDHYPVLYTGRGGYVAHECILDTRPLKKSADIDVEDIAKRLMDFGFHAPTISFPVPGTLMIEPTESESKEELDRFCQAMIKIREEIAKIETGMWDKANNPLKHAPHTLADITNETWDRPYSKAEAFSPLPWVMTNKYWPPVGRIDQAAGDRNLMCQCPPIGAYEDAA